MYQALNVLSNEISLEFSGHDNCV